MDELHVHRPGDLFGVVQDDKNIVIYEIRPSGELIKRAYYKDVTGATPPPRRGAAVAKTEDEVSYTQARPLNENTIHHALGPWHQHVDIMCGWHSRLRIWTFHDSVQSYECLRNHMCPEISKDFRCKVVGEDHQVHIWYDPKDWLGQSQDQIMLQIGVAIQ